jgi:hypothetical protein
MSGRKQSGISDRRNPEGGAAIARFVTLVVRCVSCGDLEMRQVTISAN